MNRARRATSSRARRGWTAPRPVALALLVGLSAPDAAQATDLPWLPPGGSCTVTVELAEASAETFLAVPDSLELGFGALDREVRSARVTFALGDSWALDGVAGDVDVTAPVLGQSAGGSEPGVGLIWRPVNEQVTPGAPSVALRVGWRGAGDYPADRVHAPGPGTAGYGVSVAVGKVFREALSFSAIAGGRGYADGVPAALSLKVSAALLSQPATLQRILGGMEGGLIFRLSYEREIATGALDVADPYLPSLEGDEFASLAREFTRGAVGAAVAAGAMEVAAEAFRYLDGRNVGSYEGVLVRLTLKADLVTLLGLL